MLGSDPHSSSLRRTGRALNALAVVIYLLSGMAAVGHAVSAVGRPADGVSVAVR